jgi:oxygen-independent coproporphyrinogen-3 oxidase
MCQFKTAWSSHSLYFKELPEVLIKLKEMENDGLLNMGSNTIEVTKEGQPFVRNICMAFDLLLQRKQPYTQLFSMTV